MFRRIFVVLIIFILLFGVGVGFSQTAAIVDNTNIVSDVYASSAHNVYVDTFGVNPDFALRLCGVGQKYVAAVYSANLGGGTYRYITISKNLTTGSTDTLVYTTTSVGGGCYITPVDSYAFSQFKDFARNPKVYVSAFPGRIHVLYSDSADGSSPGFVGVDTPDGWLRGSYSVSRSFNEATGEVSATVNSITFETDVGSITKSPSDADWGLNETTGRFMLVALCSDDIGDSCSDAEVVNDSSDFPVGLSLGSPANDQNVYNRYVVVNGLGYPICIGSDLGVSVSAAPSSIYHGQNSTITITVTNNGNVRVTTDFVLVLNITGPGGYENVTTWTITDDILPGGSVQRTFNWTADVTSGSYTVRTTVDSTNVINECDEGNNVATTAINVAPVYLLHVEIDGVSTNVFPYWGRPYNVTMWVEDSDGNAVANPTFKITERNGLNVFSPMQVWENNGNKYGLITYNVGEIEGNSTGYVSIVLTPTCNKLYTVYSGENVDAYVGNYSMIVNVYSGGNKLMLLYNGNLTTDYPLDVSDTSCADPGWTNDKELVNKNKYVLWIYDWIYEVYSIVKKIARP